MTAQTRAAHPFAAIPPNVWLVGQRSLAVQRQGRYTPASAAGHPGKMLPDLARRLIESYTRPGEWIVDPMSRTILVNLLDGGVFRQVTPSRDGAVTSRVFPGLVVDPGEIFSELDC